MATISKSTAKRIAYPVGRIGWLPFRGRKYATPRDGWRWRWLGFWEGVALAWGRFWDRHLRARVLLGAGVTEIAVPVDVIEAHDCGSPLCRPDSILLHCEEELVNHAWTEQFYAD